MHGLSRLASALRLGAYAAGAALLLTAVANAGECPADKVGKNSLSDAATAPKDVTDNVLASIDLASWPGLQNASVQSDRQFRMRRLEIKPGGVVPLHGHGDRPALIYVVSGEVTEYSSDCLVPIVHKAGEVSPETHEVSHWWKNTGSETVVLISADLLRDPSDHNM